MAGLPSASGINPVGVVGAAIDMGAYELEALLGDLNHDGQVNRVDAALLIRNLGISSGATPDQGDLNDDGRVALIDLAHLLLANLGATLPSPQAAPMAAASETRNGVVSAPAADLRVAATDAVFGDRNDGDVQPTTRTSRRYHSMARDGRLANRNVTNGVLVQRLYMTRLGGNTGGFSHPNGSHKLAGPRQPPACNLAPDPFK